MAGDTLIAAMTVRRSLALHESCGRVRELYPLCPRTYGVAVLADVNKRRWFPLESALTSHRLRGMFEDTAASMDRRAAARLIAAGMVHDVLGRMLPLVLLEARAWDTGPRNLWVHFDSEDTIDWVAVTDPTLRVLPGDPALARRSDDQAVVALPNEAALTTWVAHRCHRTLAPLFDKLRAVSHDAVSIPAMWHMVGSALVAAASQLPRPPRTDEFATARRSQAIADAMVGFGLPVRGWPADHGPLRWDRGGEQP